MIVAHIWDAEYPWDVRVEKIAQSLVAHGHQVHIIARNRHNHPAAERLPEGTVHRIPWLAGWGRGLNAFTQFPAFFNPRWVRLTGRTLRASSAEVLVCRDLPLAPMAIRLARARGIPMVLDMAENYPAMIADLWRSGRSRPWDGLVRNPAIARAVEQWVVRRADHILVVVDESRDRLLELGVSPDRVSVVSNTPCRAQLASRPQRRSLGTDRLQLVYIGQLDLPTRGIEPLLGAVTECTARGVQVRLTLIGDGTDKPNLMRIAEGLGLAPDAVCFRGRLPHQDALRLLGEFHVGVVPHLATDHSNTTIPNKLFDYMAAGLAVLASSARPLARIVQACGCGEVATSGDASDMARAIERLRDDEYRHRCAVAGWQAAAEQYHWERDADRLQDALDAVVPHRAGKPPGR